MIMKSLAAFAATTALLTTVATAQTGGRKLQTSLTGAAEVPGPGDTDGTGMAEITVNAGQNQVCYKLSVANIATTSVSTPTSACSSSARRPSARTSAATACAAASSRA